MIKYAVNGKTHVTLQAEQAQVLFMDKHRLTFLNQLWSFPSEPAGSQS